MWSSESIKQFLFGRPLVKVDDKNPSQQQDTQLISCKATMNTH
jgi:hypothetical protein